MEDSYGPFMGRKGKSWGELELQSIAGRVAGVPDAVTAAAREMAGACRTEGVTLERAKAILEEAFSAPSPGGSPRQ
jgi:hypothetical protein